MFDWLNNLRKSAAEKEQEAITAYLDGAMSDRDTAAFESRLRDDAVLQAAVDSQRAVKALLARTPRLRAPRNFVLDPAVYGRQKPRPVPVLARIYPQLRTATVVASLLFAVVLTLNLWSTGGPATFSDNVAMAPEAASDAAAEPAVLEIEAVAEEAVVEMEMVEEVLDAPPDQDDTVGVEQVVVLEDEAGPEGTAAAPALTMEAEAGFTTSQSMPQDGSEDMGEMEAADAAEEFPSPRATATSTRSRVVTEDEATDPDLFATPVPLPTALPADGEATGDVSEVLAGVPEEAPAGEQADFQRARTPFPWGLLSLLLGVAAVMLLTITLFARRQARR